MERTEPAGDLPAWLAEMRAALRDGGGMDVPCGTCSACCRSAQFVDIAPDEVDALAHIPAAMLSPAPGSPAGHRVLGYDEHGHCPLLVDGACSIYEHRPRACRVYDCRVFAAAGVEPDQPLVADRVRRWRFASDGGEQGRGVRAAARFMATRAGDHPALENQTALAVLAVEFGASFEAGADPAQVWERIRPRR